MEFKIFVQQQPVETFQTVKTKFPIFARRADYGFLTALPFQI